MKTLLLREILKQIGGKVIHGKEDFLIRHVIKKKKFLRYRSTLMFYEKHYFEMDWQMFKPLFNCVVVTDNPPGTPKEWGQVTVVQVPNVKEAYWKFVDYYRQLFSIPVFAITGTCGKTTVKEMIKQALAIDHEVVGTYYNRTASSLNLPYLMEIGEDTQVGVFETGVYYPDDLLETCQHYQPTIGIITNIDVDHIQGCGSFENYVKAKAEMLPGLKYQGTLILNCDDEHIAKFDLTPYQGKVVYFGQSERADYRVSGIKLVHGGMKFRLHHKGNRYWFFVPEYGVHSVYNALAAIAGLHELGMTLREIRTRLCAFKNLVGHFTVFTGVNGATVVDDTWKATPISMEAAVKTLKQIAGNKRRVLISGRMASDVADYLHEGYQRIGRLIAETGVDMLITRGEEAKLLVEAAIQSGMKPEQVIMCRDDFDEVFQAVTPYLNPQTIVLVKSSWSDPSDPLLEKLQGETNGGAGQ